MLVTGFNNQQNTLPIKPYNEALSETIQTEYSEM